MITAVEVVRDPGAAVINRIVNNPEVRPFIGVPEMGEVDMSTLVGNPRNCNLIGEHGGMLAVQHLNGIYEIHTHVLKSGRGAWAIGMVKAALHHLFTRENAVEVLTKVPKGNIAARAMVRVFGGTYEATIPAGWNSATGEPIDADVYARTIQEWARSAPELVTRGAWVMDRIRKGVSAISGMSSPPVPKVDLTGESLAFGLLYEMIIGGQFEKAGFFFNRWASYRGAMPVSFLTVDPVTLTFGPLMVIVRGGDVWVPLVEPEHPTRQ